MTDPKYIADEKSDIYSLGVMMFELITKKHPYINQNCKSNREYTLLLKNSPLVLTENVKKFSAPMQGLFDLVIRMVAKDYKDRPFC